MSEKHSKTDVSWELVEAVQQMQDYIKEHALDENFCVNDVYILAGYSKRHCERIFKKLTNKTINEYIRAIRLSNSAVNLLGHQSMSVLEVAIDTNFQSHEGYTRAFNNAFGITPDAYRKDPIAIPLFIQYPVRAYHSYLNQKETMKMNKEELLCMITVVNRPKRKLLLLRSKKAHDYWSYCEEMGCDWEGLFNSIPEKYDTAAILELPEFLQKSGSSKVASGVELPFDYSGKIPANCELVEVDACDMLYFQTESFEKEEEFGAAIDSVFRAIDKYDIAFYGYEYAFELAPKFNFGASTQMGAKMALPVRRKC